MTWKSKFWLGTSLLAVALIGGLYASGFLTLTLLGLDVDVSWRTWWPYWQAIALPQFAPYVWKIKVATAVGFIVPLAVWIAALIPLLRTKQRSLHGESRFAQKSDLAKAGLLKDSPNGIVVGKFGKELIRLSGQQFAILAAPTRSGKGVGVVIPNLLEYQESIVVLDIKQENFDLTSGWRASQGHEIYLFNPFAEDRRTHRWNPLSYISPNPSFRISDIQSIAAMLYPDGSDGQKFWVSQARNAFTAFTLYLFENFDTERKLELPFGAQRFPTLGEVYRLSSGDGSDLRTYLQGLTTRPFLSKDAKTAFANLLSQAEETFASIMGTFKEPLNAWINPVLDAATSRNDFLLTDVRKKKMTIYIGIQPNKLAESRLIINLFFSQLINVNTRELPQNNPELKHQCLLLMDEFTSIGRVDILASSVSYMAGYNIRLLPIIQSMAQLDATYGKDVSRTIITNHALQIIYAPREQQDANDYSDMLGYTTVRKESVTRGRDTSRSHSDERRALMLPQELKAMGTDKEVILFEGIPHPVKCDKIRYYEDKRFTARLLPKVDVPVLQLERSVPMGKKTIAIAAVTSLALAGFAQSSAEPAATKKEGAPMTSETTGPQATKTARDALARFFGYVSTLRSTSELTKASVEHGMGIAFGKDEEGDFYRSPGLGGGWTYVIRHHDPRGRLKPGVTFGFFNPDPSADPTPICVATLDQIRASFASRGFPEAITPGEIGQVVAWNFVKNDLVFTVTPLDVTTWPDGTECVRVIQTTDG
jgi:type IV secretion system protein VirD4